MYRQLGRAVVGERRVRHFDQQEHIVRVSLTLPVGRPAPTEYCEIRLGLGVVRQDDEILHPDNGTIHEAGGEQLVQVAQECPVETAGGDISTISPLISSTRSCSRRIPNSAIR